MSLQNLYRRIAILDAKLHASQGQIYTALWLPDNGRETTLPDTHLPLVIYDPATGAPLPGYEAIAERLHPNAKLYGFNPDGKGVNDEA